MKKLFFIFYATSVSLIFFNESLSMNPKRKKNQSPLSQEKYLQIALAATIYNNNHLPPDEISNLIFSFCCDKENTQEESFAENFVNLTNTSNTCKRFQQLLSPEIIINLCSPYNATERNKRLIKMINESTSAGDINNTAYTIYRDLMLIFMLSDSHPIIKANNLLLKGVTQNDIPMARILFKRGASPNAKHTSTSNPIFFYINTIEMAELFIEAGANVNEPGNYTDPSILSQMLNDSYSIELMKFYISKGAKIYSFSLQQLALIASDKALEKATFLLTTRPNLINILNGDENTPLDMVILKLRNNYTSHLAIEKFFELFKQHGGLTGEELKQQSMLLQQ